MPKSGLLDLAAIRNNTPFADVLTHYGLETPRPGATQLKINCPFHEDSTPSCSINLQKGIFKCFGCQAKGNVLDFIAQYEEFPKNGPYKAALLAVDIMGGEVASFRKSEEIENTSPMHQKTGVKGSGRKRRKLADTIEPTSEGDTPAPRQTPNSVIDISLQLDPEHEFLADRGIDPETAEAFGIGFCKAGIMRNRIAVPIHNPVGELVAYTGRYASEELPDKKTPRYKLPKGFEKSLELFNLHRAAELNKPYVVIVEGIWSTIRLHQAGVPVVALLGTAVSEAQAALLPDAGFRYAILILDGDDAGRQATPDAVHILSQSLYVKTLVLPEGVKPDTMDASIVSRLRR